MHPISPRWGNRFSPGGRVPHEISTGYVCSGMCMVHQVYSTKTTSHKLDVFQNRCLHKTPNIFWTNTILCAGESPPNQLPRYTDEQVKLNRTCTPNATHIPVAFRWTPGGRRHKGRRWRNRRGNKDRLGDTWKAVWHTDHGQALMTALCAHPTRDGIKLDTLRGQ